MGGLAVMPLSERPTPSGAVDALMLDLPRMRALTGAGEDLTIIPSMDGKSPVDIDLLARDAPAPCRFIFAETETFGPDLSNFHKTTYQNPPDGAIISQGAGAYRDPQTARAALDDLVGAATACGNYHVKSAVLVEVTFCAFPESVSELVMVNLLQGVPG